jgi:hypothetical protein
MTVRQIDYEKLRVEQYKSLKKEAMDLATATRRIETYIIGATGSVRISNQGITSREGVGLVPSCSSGVFRGLALPSLVPPAR